MSKLNMSEVCFGRQASEFMCHDLILSNESFVAAFYDTLSRLLIVNDISLTNYQAVH